jgi:hypothetical protein
MDDLTRRSRNHRPSPGRAVGLALALALSAAPRAQAEPPWFAASEGLELASAAAQAWSADAVLVYLENDEDLDGSGRSTRWGYLFHSPSQERSRAWSVRGGKLVAAENLDMRFDAPPLGAGWLDSGAALAAAEEGGGARFRKDHRGRLVTMLLMRGAFSEGDPDATTWTFVYSSPGATSLYVVVDAGTGKVQRTWRG